jgi:NACHT domain
MEEKICPREQKIPNQKLRQERERRGWTHNDVAQYMNYLPDFSSGEIVSHNIQQWEDGFSLPGPRYCYALCLIFHMDAQALGLVASPVDERNNVAPPEKYDTYRTIAQQDIFEHAQHSFEMAQPEIHTYDPTGSHDHFASNGPAHPSARQAPEQLTEYATRYDSLTSIDNIVSRNIKNIIHPQEKNNRQHLLRRVRRFWITDVLEHSLHHATLIELGLQTRPDAVINPWHLLQESAQAKRTLSPRTSIIQVYDEADGALLILGEPGAGKTTLLLELTRTLLNRAEQDETALIPVVFNLSSWTIKRSTMRDWLIEELHDKYQVPRKVGQSWVDNERILLLLDGLDEVTSIHRNACIEEINLFRRKHGLVPIVVCSRSAEYHALASQLGLQMAIVIQPLNAQQIEQYLRTVGKPLEALRLALQQDFSLQELATTPLMLSVLTLAYHGMPLDGILKNNSLDAKRQQIFATYVQRMLTRRGTSTNHPPTQTVQWLAYLARQMKQQNQSVFYIEHIQPDWLEDPQFKRIYERLAIQLIGTCIGALVSLVVSLLFLGTLTVTIRTIYGLMGALLGGLLSGRIAGPPALLETQSAHTMKNWLMKFLTNAPVRNGICVALITILMPGSYTWHLPLKGIIVGTSFGLTSSLLSVLLIPGQRDYKKHTFYTLLKQGTLIGGLIGLCTGLSFGFLIGPTIGIGFGLIVGISFGLIAVLLLLFFAQRSQTIQLAEIITWSPQGLIRGLISTRYLRQGALVGGLVSLGVGLSNALIFGPSVTLAKNLSIELNSMLSLGNDAELIYRAIVGLGFGLCTGLGFGLSYCVILGLLHGLMSYKIEGHRRLTPNQGIGRSARNGLIVGALCGWISWGIQVMMLFLFTKSYSFFTAGLSSWLSKDSSGQLNQMLNQGLDEVLGLGLHNALFIGPSCGLLVGLLIGGWACIQHTVLRVLLWRSGAIPWNYSQFLDFATERILLRKVGGGYIFVHRLLLDYFSSLVPGSGQEPRSLPSGKNKL